MNLIALMLILTLKGGVAMAADDQQPLEPIGLATAFREYLHALPGKALEKVPDEFHSILFMYTESPGATGDQTIGGWYLDRHKTPWTLTRWHKVSNTQRVAAVLDVRRSNGKWVFDNAQFLSAKTKTIPTH